MNPAFAPRGLGEAPSPQCAGSAVRENGQMHVADMVFKERPQTFRQLKKNIATVYKAFESTIN